MLLEQVCSFSTLTTSKVDRDNENGHTLEAQHTCAPILPVAHRSEREKRIFLGLSKRKLLAGLA